MVVSAAVGQVVQIVPPGQRGRLQINEANAVAGVYLPTDRALSRAIARARTNR